MASSKEVIELLFNAEYAGKAEVRALKRDLNDLANDFGNGLSTVSAYTIALAGIEAAAIAASIGLAKASNAAAEEFSAGFNEITTLITDPTADFDLLKQQIKDYAATSTLSLSQINTAVYNAISAGIDYKDSLDIIAQAEKLNVAGKGEMESTIKVLNSVLSAYGEEADQAGKYSDLLFNTVKNGVTTLPELSSSIAKVTSVAAPLGISFEEVTAAVAQLTTSGFSTSESVTILSELLAGLTKPTKEAADTASELGIEFSASALKTNTLAGFMQLLADKTGGNVDVTNKLFGSQTALKGALALTSDVGLAGLIDKLGAAQNAAGSTSLAFDKMMENFDLINQTLSNQIQLTLIEIGEPLGDAFDNIDQAVIKIFDTLRKNITEQDGALVPLIDSVQGVANTIADIITGIANNLDGALNQADLSGFSDAFDSINDALNGLDLTSTDGLASAIGGIGKAFDGLTKFSIEATAVVKDMLVLLGDLAGYLKDVDKETIKTAGSIGGWAIALTAASVPLSALLSVLLAMKQIGGLPGAFGSAAAIAASSKAAGGLLGVVGKLGVVGASLAGGYYAGGAAVEYFDEKTGLLTGTIKESTIAGESLTNGLEQFRKETGNANATMADYSAYLKQKVESEQGSVRALNDMGDAIGEVSLKTKLSAEEQANWNRFVENGYSWTKQTTDAVKDNANALTVQGQAAKEASAKTQEISDAAKATKAALENLSDVRPVFDLQIAKVKSEADQVKSIMDSLAASANAAGAGLGGAFDAINGANYSEFDFFQQDTLFDSIEKQTEALAELAQAQGLVAKAKANYMNSQATSMQNGDPLINIDGTNLDGPLTALFMEVLKLVQIQVSQDQADFLLGMPQ